MPTLMDDQCMRQWTLASALSRFVPALFVQSGLSASRFNECLDANHGYLG